MSKKVRFLPSAAMGVALAALVVALGGVAFASIPSPDGAINACYSNSNGALRVIDSTESCPVGGGETPLSLAAPVDLDRLRPYVAFTPAPRAPGGVKFHGEGIRSVKRIRRGIFCVRPATNFEEIFGIATAEFKNNSDGLAMAFIKTRRPECPKFSLEVVTGRLRHGSFTLQDEAAIVDSMG